MVKITNCSHWTADHWSARYL